MNWLIAINVIGFIIIIRLTYYDHYFGALVFPVLNDILKEQYEFSKLTSIILQILFGIIFFPALVIYFVLLFIILLFCAVFAKLTDPKTYNKRRK